MLTAEESAVANMIANIGFDFVFHGGEISQ